MTDKAAALERVKSACNDVITATSAALGLTAAAKARRERRAQAAAAAAGETADVLHDAPRRSKAAAAPCACGGAAAAAADFPDARAVQVHARTKLGATRILWIDRDRALLFSPAPGGTWLRRALYAAAGKYHVAAGALSIKKLPPRTEQLVMRAKPGSARVARPNPVPASSAARATLLSDLLELEEGAINGQGVVETYVRGLQLAIVDAGIVVEFRRVAGALNRNQKSGVEGGADFDRFIALVGKIREQILNASEGQIKKYWRVREQAIGEGVVEDGGGRRRPRANPVRTRAQRLAASPPAAAVPVVPFIKCVRDEKAYAAALAAAAAIGPVRDARDVYRVLSPVLGKEDQEVFGVLLVDTRGQCIGWHETCRGTRDAVAAPARLFQPIPTYAPHRYMIVHNHPTGQADPSPQDRELTVRMRALAALYLPESVLVDHVILGVGQCYSFSAGAKGAGKWHGKLLRFTTPKKGTTRQ